jgi:heterotetrameric sarcosine oxidase gamma subunit
MLKGRGCVAETLPIIQAPPVVMVKTWPVSARSSPSPLRLIDCTPCEKTLFRGTTDSATARVLNVGRGRVRRDESGMLVAGVSPAEWIVIGAPGVYLPSALSQSSDGLAQSGIVDITHARALIRIVGADSAKVLSKLCGINFADTTTPDDMALRTSVARLVVEVIRNDLAQPGTLATNRVRLARSYLIMRERSAGQYLFDALLDAGQEFGVDVEGFAAIGSIYNGGVATR